MKDECDVMNESHDIPDDYKLRLLIKWEMQGTIDPGSGEPGLGDEGAIFTFTPSCGAISHIGWNGGRGRPDPVRFAGVLPQGDSDPHDIFLSLEMSGALLAGPGIEDPKNIKVVDKDGEEQSGWNVDIRCGKDFSESGWGWAWWKKNCWIKAERSNCKDVDIPIPGTGAQVCWDE